jgi:CheY-like chemotaxis protein
MRIRNTKTFIGASGINMVTINNRYENEDSVFHAPQSIFLQHRILCVDDDIAGATIRGQILKEEGYFVVTYHCPLAALHCDLSTFSLAVIDFSMPSLNGRELLLRMRASGARFPIVLLSGSIDALSYEDRILFARCIDKGRSVRCLLDTIAEFLSFNQIPDFDA